MGIDVKPEVSVDKLAYAAGLKDAELAVLMLARKKEDVFNFKAADTLREAADLIAEMGN
jgi:hypothetical protein